jgi:hypothetical protein
MPVLPRKRPCCICHRWFRPDNRVGLRQRACSRAECQWQRRRRRQAAWRGRNRDYFRGHRIQARGAGERAPEPLRLPPPLNQLPWDIAQSQFGVQGADFIGVMGALLLHTTQSQFKLYVSDFKVDAATLPRLGVQSQMKKGADWSGAGEQGDATGMAPT